MVERAIEDKPDTTETTDKINALRNEHQKLFAQVMKLSQENKILTARLRAKDTAFHDINVGVVNLFRYGCKEYYTADEIKDAAGLGGHGRLDPKIHQEILKSADYTLAQLEAVGFIKKHWKGWQWVI